MAISDYLARKDCYADRWQHETDIRGAFFPKTMAFAILALLVWIAPALAEPDEDPKLLQLARAYFNKHEDTKLTGAGEALFRAVAIGDWDARNSIEKKGPFGDPAKWSDSRLVKAAWIVWLATDPDASKLVTYRGIRIDGARIDGEIVLNSAHVPFPLVIRESAFTGDVSMQGVHLGELDLRGSRLREVRADRAQIEYGVILEDVFVAGGVNFAGATIGGNLNCAGSYFSNVGGVALCADGAKIGGDVLLRTNWSKIFKANGEVSLIGVTIGGSLSCMGSHFRSNDLGPLFKPIALNAENAKIAGDLILGPKFAVDGEVSLSRAAVTGYMELTGSPPLETTSIDLASAKIGTLRDDSESWPGPGNYFLDGFVYDRIDLHSPKDSNSRLAWLERMHVDHFLSQPYAHLAGVLRTMGYDEQAAQVLITLNQKHGQFIHSDLGRDAKGGILGTTRAWIERVCSPNWWYYRIIGPLVGYGYRPGRLLYVGFFLIVLGSLILQKGHSCGLIWPSGEGVVEKDFAGKPNTANGQLVVPQDYPKFNAFFYSLESFTPFVDLDQCAHWRPNAGRGREHRLLWFRVTNGGLLRAYLWGHVISGWLLATLWLRLVADIAKG